MSTAEPTFKRLKSEEEKADVAFNALEKTLRELDEKREFVIKRSRDVQKSAKQAIYALQRLNVARANELIDSCEVILGNELLPAVQADPELRYGSVASCAEEYAEAVIFRAYLVNSASPFPMLKEEFKLALSADEYLGGLFDATGEIQRHAVVCATKRDVATVERAREYVDYVMGRAQQFDLRNGNLRKKSDTIKVCPCTSSHYLYLSLAQRCF